MRGKKAVGASGTARGGHAVNSSARQQQQQQQQQQQNDNGTPRPLGVANNNCDEYRAAASAAAQPSSSVARGGSARVAAYTNQRLATSGANRDCATQPAGGGRDDVTCGRLAFPLSATHGLSSTATTTTQSTTSGGASDTSVVGREPARLVFGLSERTNRTKHNDYAAGRSNVPAASALAAAGTQASGHAAAAAHDKLAQHTRQQEQSSRSSLDAANGSKAQHAATVTLISNNNCLHTQQAGFSINFGTDNTDRGQLTSRSRESISGGRVKQQRQFAGCSGAASLTSSESGRAGNAKTMSLASGSPRQQANTRSSDNNTNKQHTSSANNKASGKAAMTTAGSANQKSISGRAANDKSSGSGGQMVAGGAVKLANGSPPAGATPGGQMAAPGEQTATAVAPPIKMQFNIPPPPKMRSSTQSGSIVSAAKSRIYQAKPSGGLGGTSSLASGGAASATSADGTGAATSSSALLDSGAIPTAISRGFKPPRLEAVNVSKARARWEGGEPFATSKFGRLTANKQQHHRSLSTSSLPGGLGGSSSAAGHQRRLSLHGGWAMASVVATQRRAFTPGGLPSTLGSPGSSLMAANGDDPSNEPQPMKVLSRGSVLERVQQFERAPRAAPTRSHSLDSGTASASSAELLLASSPSNTDDSGTGSVSGDELSASECELSIRSPLSPSSPSSPTTTGLGAGKLGSTSSVVSTLGGGHARNVLRRQTAIATSSGSGATTSTGELGEGARGRRSSSGGLMRSQSTTAASSGAGAAHAHIHAQQQQQQHIPKFYHPNGKPNTYELELQRRTIAACFDTLPERKAALGHAPSAASRRHFAAIAQACGLPPYCKPYLYEFVKHHARDGFMRVARHAGGSAMSRQASLARGASLSRRASLATTPTQPAVTTPPASDKAVPQAGVTTKTSLARLGGEPVQGQPASGATKSAASRQSRLSRSASMDERKMVAAAAATTRGSAATGSRTVTAGGSASQQSQHGAKMLLLTRGSSVDTPAALQDAQRGLTSSTDTTSSLDNDSSPPLFVTCDEFLWCWRHLSSACFDAPSRLVHLLTKGARTYLLPDDFVPLIQCVIDEHPGLKFLRSAPDFHMRYIQTVIARIYYNVNRSWTGKITLTELRRSNLMQIIAQLAKCDDINKVTEYFSYEHFYVIYCKFWSLDTDHDLLISKQDLARHNDASISARIIERIFMGINSKQIQTTGMMSYSDFVWFLLAEEDKKHPRSVEYWFRLMDTDGDGFISMYEMEYFYDEQVRRLELMNIEPLPFLDSVCQILDLINPRQPNKIALADLKRSKMATIFFDTFMNLEKYLEHESREFVSTRDLVEAGVRVSDWDRYAREEYENLIANESEAQSQQASAVTCV